MLPGRNLKSYLLRFRTTSLPELVYRAKQAYLVFRLKHNARLERILPKVPEVDEVALHRLQLPHLQGHIDGQVLNMLLDGQVFTINGEKQIIDRFEEESCGVFFTDLKLGPRTPDIRVVWEPARLQHIAMLLFSANLNGGSQNGLQARGQAKKSLFEWIRQNPFPTGPHYLSAMECGLRIPVFFYALKILEDLSGEEHSQVLEAIHRHAWWISRRLSLYSSRGNHTVCECVGLVFAGVIFQASLEGRAWLSRGLEILRQEIYHQILDDGGPGEQSFLYHRFVLDLYWLVLDFLKRNGVDLRSEFTPRLLLGERFLGAFREGDCLPAIGDGDDGHAIAPGIYPVRRN